MTEKTSGHSGLLMAVSDIVNDLTQLFQKELQLAKAEIAANISRRLQAGLWMVIAGVCGLIAVLLAVQALVLALIGWGLEPYWACLAVAAGMALFGGLAFIKGRSQAARGLRPERTIRQVRQSFSATKEEL